MLSTLPTVVKPKQDPFHIDGKWGERENREGAVRQLPCNPCNH